GWASATLRDSARSSSRWNSSGLRAVLAAVAGWPGMSFQGPRRIARPGPPLVTREVRAGVAGAAERREGSWLRLEGPAASGRAWPVRAAAVARRSTWAIRAFADAPAGVWPGQRTRNGTRLPPS